MCQLYPEFRTCCGIPLRTGLIFIALLSIVTGALINAAIKKAGVNVSTIQDVGALGTDSKITNGSTNSSKSSHRSKTQQKRRAMRAAADRDYFDNIRDPVIYPTKRQWRTTVWKYSTVEIIGEDGHTEIIRFEDSAEAASLRTFSATQFDDIDSLTINYAKSSKAGARPTNTTSNSTTTTNITTTTTNITTTTVAPVDKYIMMMSKVNRNGLNLLSIAFIVLGILLFVANFMNSPEVALIWVVLCVVLCGAALVLLVTVLGECATNPEACLLRRMDWMSAFLVGLFWFLYIFVWAYFAAVGNALARDVPLY